MAVRLGWADRRSETCRQRRGRHGRISAAGAEDGSTLTRRRGSKRVIGVKGVGSP